jgi:hypothetical protein
MTVFIIVDIAGATAEQWTWCRMVDVGLLVNSSLLFVFFIPLIDEGILPTMNHPIHGVTDAPACNDGS